MPIDPQTLAKALRDAGIEVGQKHAVLFADGHIEELDVFVTSGPAMLGDPTAYVYRDGVKTWVKPGTSAEYIEHQSADPGEITRYALERVLSILRNTNAPPWRNDSAKDVITDALHRASPKPDDSYCPTCGKIHRDHPDA